MTLKEISDDNRMESETPMKLFLVDVDCWYDTIEKTVERVCERRSFLVEADNAAEAHGKGLHIAEHTAACSYKLVGAEWRRTASLDLPMEVLGDDSLRVPTTFRNLAQK